MRAEGDRPLLRKTHSGLGCVQSLESQGGKGVGTACGPWGPLLLLQTSQAKATFPIIATVQMRLLPVLCPVFEERKKKGPGPDPHTPSPAASPAGLGDGRWQEGVNEKICMRLGKDGLET